MDSKGNVLFSDKMHNRLRFIDRKGFIYTLAGSDHQGNEGDGGPVSEASLYLPGSMAVDQKTIFTSFLRREAVNLSEKLILKAE